MKNKHLFEYGDYARFWKQAAPKPNHFSGKWRSLLRSNVLSVSSLLNKKQEGKYLRCLYCHYVFDDQREDFEKLMIKLKQIGQFVDTSTCLQMLLDNKMIDQRYFHLSFDDGFRNNFTNAIPILSKLKIPAIFFVPSSFIEADWDITFKYCLQTMHYRGVIEMLKWNDIHEILSFGFEIGSHTKTHMRFSAISNDLNLMKEEILGSKIEIETNTGVECKYISWPFGKLRDADDKSLQMVKSAGYTACFGAYRGTILPGKTNIYSIPRHQFEVQWPVSHTLFFARGNMEI